MIVTDSDGAGLVSRIVSQFPVPPAMDDDYMAENVRSAVARGLPEVRPAKAHHRIMSIAAGGPSLQDTFTQLDGVVVAVNGSLAFLLERGVTPWACGVFDPRPHMADVVEPHKDVFYFLGSTCHPRLFDRLKGCNVGIWHPLGMPGIETLAKGAKHFIGGGTTMGLRWFNLGYLMGFRRFHAHGLDSSFRDGKTHAYPDRRDAFSSMMLCGYRTSMNFIKQVDDWFQLKRLFAGLDDEPSIKLYGEGLLQDLDRRCST